VKQDLSFEEELSKEIEGVKVGTKKRFFSVPIKSKGICFIRIADENIPPITLLSKIFIYMKENQVACFKTRHTSRVIPIEGTCASKLESVLQLANVFIPPRFHPPEEPSTFRVDLKRRSNNSFPRDNCTKELVKLVNHNNKVDLKNPDKIIILEILKGVAAMSVVSMKDFQYGFNIRILMSESKSGKKRDREEDEHKEGPPPNAKKQRTSKSKTNPSKQPKPNDTSSQLPLQTTDFDTKQPQNQQDDSDENDDSEEDDILCPIKQESTKHEQTTDTNTKQEHEAPSKKHDPITDTGTKLPRNQQDDSEEDDFRIFG